MHGFLPQAAPRAAHRRNASDPRAAFPPRRVGWLARDRNVFASAGLLAIGALALALWIVVTDYRETRAQAEIGLANIADALERDVARNVELYNLTLQETMDSLRLPGLAETNAELRYAAMFDRIAAADYMSTVRVVDAVGHVTAASDGLVPHGADVADREYFRYLRDHPTDDLYISAPLIAGSSGNPVIVFARRLAHPDASFAGLVTGSVSIDYFRRLFSALDLGEGGSVSLLRTDGVVLVRYPAAPAGRPDGVAAAAPLSAMLQTGSGHMEGLSAMNGVRRLYAYRTVGILPLLVSASVERDAVFAAWQRKAVLVLSAFAVLVGVAAALLVALRRQLAYRAAAERDALAAADRARRSERTLALSLDQLDAILQNSADIHFAASRRGDGRFVFDLLNRRGEEITGLRADAMIGRTPEECLSPEAAALVLARWEQCLRDRRPIAYEHGLTAPAGRSHWETSLVPVHDADGAVCRLIGTTRDITHRKQTEATLLTRNSDLERRAAAAVAAQDDALARASAAERLQLLGQLASGIAHDVNNVLQSVAGGAALVERRADDPTAMRRAARLIADAAERGASITHRLLAFSRDEAGPSERIAIAPVLADLVEIMRHTLRGIGPIEIAVQCDDDALTVVAERNQLQTVLLNLATNARDAMPQGGTLVLGARAGSHPALANGEHTRLWVQDTGTGMDRATLARVTEPFFTTKPVGEGTGLGLSMADAYARESGGLLAIDSEPGRGTTVDLWLRR